MQRLENVASSIGKFNTPSASLTTPCSGNSSELPAENVTPVRDADLIVDSGTSSVAPLEWIMSAMVRRLTHMPNLSEVQTYGAKFATIDAPNDAMHDKPQIEIKPKHYLCDNI